MEDQSEEPRASIEVMFCGEDWRVGVVDREETISEGRLERKAPRQFIVRGTWGKGVSELTWGEKGGEKRTPLKPIHFNPTSRINSAVSTLCFLSFDLSVARSYNWVNPSGEFIVIVAAVCFKSVYAFIPSSLLNLGLPIGMKGYI